MTRTDSTSRPDSSSPWQVGQTIADLYRIRAVNTEGGMAIVYFAWHTGWHIELVIKSPRPELLIRSEDRDRFVEEAETWVRLGVHPNIVSAYYVRQIEDFPRIILEKMEGGSLKRWLAEGKVQDLATALDIAIQVVKGLAYAQRRQPGFVHRDLKPSNVLLTPAGEAKVTDFGLVGAIGVRVGTPAYMAPEAWEDAEGVTPAADVYAFGVVLYELLAGRRPFDRGEEGTSLGQLRGGGGVEGSLGVLRELEVEEPSEASVLSLGGLREIERVSDWSLGEVSGRTMLEVLTGEALSFYRAAHVHMEPAPPSWYSRSLPEELDALCLALLTKDPRRRPAAAEVAARLKEIYARCVGQHYLREEPKEVHLLADRLNNQALSYLDMDREEAAVASWKEAAHVHPTHLETSFNLGYWQWRNGLVDDLQYLTLLTDLKETYGEQPEYWRALAAVQIERGHPEAAAQAMRQTKASGREAVEILPSSPDCHLAHTFAFPDRVHSVACSPRGRYVLVGGRDKICRLLDLTRRRSIDLFTERAALELYCVAFSPDGCSVAWGMNGYGIKIWDISNKSVRTLEDIDYGNPRFQHVPASSVASFAFSHQGNFLVCGYRSSFAIYGDQPILVWDLDTGKCVQTLEGHPNSVYSVALSPDERYLLSGGADGLVKHWELSEGECKRSFRGHEGVVYAVAFHHDGDHALSAGSDGTLKHWKLSTGECIQTYRGHAGTVFSLALSPDGSSIASGGEDGTVKIWDVSSGQCRRTLEGPMHSVRSVTFSSDGEYVLSGGTDGSVRMWQVHLSEARHVTYLLSVPRTTSVILKRQEAFQRTLREADALLADGRNAEAYQVLRQAQAKEGYEQSPDILDRIDLCSKGARRVGLRSGWPKAVLKGHTDGVTAVDFSPDGKYLVSGSADGTVRLWKRASETCLRIFEEHRHTVSAVAFSPDGAHLLSAGKPMTIFQKGRDQTLRLWNIESGMCVSTFRGYKGGISSVAFVPDSDLILSGAWEVQPDPEDHVIQQWCLRKKKVVASFKGHADVIEAVALSTDGGCALSGSRDRTLRLWEVRSGSCVQIFRGHGAAVYDVALSPDGRYALSGGADDLVKLWDLGAGTCIKTLEGHRDTVFAVAFSPDGRYALSGSEDTKIRLWELSTGDCLRIFQGHTAGVMAMRFSPDGRFVVSGGYDGDLLLWEFDWAWAF